MKAKNGHSKRNGKTSLQELILRAATTQKLADAARKHFKTLKADYNDARKAFKQAKKAAKSARKDLEAARALKPTNGATKHRPRSRPIEKRSAHLPPAPAARPTEPEVSIAPIVPPPPSSPEATPNPNT